ncbi:ThuA domain-containing protein [Cellulomonas sp. KRMCY2]|uniref:ThuA domain-containing protein n=1 Tax=Cellulomonas sp. KRMCY2 TaxID=1304865 RepID=UPI00045E5C12|nr:ThuA domain-containing protein [Cellulomonas sp. KRMCY2]
MTADDALRVLLLPGGPEFHVPGQIAATLARLVSGPPGRAAVCDLVDDLDILADGAMLAEYDLVVPVWTEGALTEAQAHGLESAVRGGTGLGCIHGAAAAFRLSATYQGLVGGQFVDHPGGEIPYTVTVDRSHVVTASVPDFAVTTEKYYLHVDPANRVLATTRFDGDFGPLSSNGAVVMPVAWTRTYGTGRVFYCALGHRPDVLEAPAVSRLMARGLRWAAGAL